MVPASTLAESAAAAAAAALVSPLLDGARRKAYAAVQRRVGPPLLQTWYDLAKLFSRSPVAPRGAGLMPYYTGPVLSLALAVLAAAALAGGFRPWPLACVLLLEASAYSVVAGAVGLSPYTSLGSARLWAVAGLADAGVLVAVLSAPRPPGVFAAAAAFASAVMAAAAELELPPYNVAEAGPEIAAGPYTEYSGPLLGFASWASMIRGFTLAYLAAVYAAGLGWAPGLAAACAIYLVYAAASAVIGRPRPARALGLAAAAFSLGVVAAALAL